MAKNTILKGSGDFKWQAEIDGQDILVLNVRATAFGGSNDPQDNGETASGVNTKVHPFIQGVAIPMRGFGVKSLEGSPIPRMPFGVKANGADNPEGAHVIVEDVVTGKRSPTWPVLDIGPSGFTNNAIDLSVSAARYFDPKASAINFSRKVNYRILNGAKYLS